jgi:ectoine hydroxylase-related dioxygenase (phytanoyl-CoA dioxygenase family)
VEEYARILGELKPRFIHHPECKRLLPKMLELLGCDQEKTYFDVPRMRTSTSDNYLTTGIAYAFHPHRDTWYSAPMCQLNWWMPVYPVTSENCMAFHPRFWSRGVRNSSEIYNYQQWTQQSRFNAAQHIGADSRPQPKALEPIELDPDLRILPEVGGVIIFSGAQLHSSIPNTSGRTRYSLDFRTVHHDDVENRSGAVNVDSRCTGSTMDDYLRCTDLEHLKREVIAPYDAGPPAPPGSLPDRGIAQA